MPDVFTKAKRSVVMSRIRGRGNKDTELALAKIFRQYRITGWRRNQTLFGKPDFAFRRCHRANENQPPMGGSKPATLR